MDGGLDLKGLGRFWLLGTVATKVGDRAGWRLEFVAQFSQMDQGWCGS